MEEQGTEAAGTGRPERRREQGGQRQPGLKVRVWIGGLSGLKHRAQLLNQVWKGYGFQLSSQVFPRSASVHSDLGRQSCPPTVWPKHCLRVQTTWVSRKLNVQKWGFLLWDHPKPTRNPGQGLTSPYCTEAHKHIQGKALSVLAQMTPF